MIDRQVLHRRHAEEEQRFIATHARSAELAKEAQANLLCGVPMSWMTRWPGSFPLFFDPNFDAHVQKIEGRPSPEVVDDSATRWDQANVHAFHGRYGDYLLAKVSKVFPQLVREVL